MLYRDDLGNVESVGLTNSFSHKIYSEHQNCVVTKLRSSKFLSTVYMILREIIVMKMPFQLRLF